MTASSDAARAARHWLPQRVAFGSAEDEATQAKHAVLLVVAVALVVRLLMLALARAPAIENDAVLYNGVGANLAQGHGYVLNGAPFAGREPGYILVVALTYLITGVHTTAVYVVQALAAALACAVTFAVARRLAGLHVALWAGLLLALAPSFLGYTNVVLTEIFATLWFALALLWLIKLSTRPGWRSTAVAGVVIGLAALTRTNFLVLIVAAPLGLRAADLSWRAALKYGGGAALVAALVYAPWVVRNAVAMDTFIPTRLGMGEAVWSGSYVPWDGQWLGYIPPLTTLEAGLSPIEADRKMWHEALENVRRDPLGVARIWAKKPFYSWLVGDPSLLHSNPFGTTDFSKVSLALLLQAFVEHPLQVLVLCLGQAFWNVSLLLAGYGAIRRRREPGIRLILVVLLLSTLGLVPGNPQPRYVTPLSPGVYVLAGCGLVDLAGKLRGRLASRPSTE